eukprot:2677525-Rhodomonas_salina.7
MSPSNVDTVVSKRRFLAGVRAFILYWVTHTFVTSGAKRGKLTRSWSWMASRICKSVVPLLGVTRKCTVMKPTFLFKPIAFAICTWGSTFTLLTVGRGLPRGWFTILRNNVSVPCAPEFTWSRVLRLPPPVPSSRVTTASIMVLLERLRIL